MEISKEVRREIWELHQKGLTPGLIERETGYNRDMVVFVLSEPHLSGRISPEDHRKLWAFKYKGYSRQKVADLLNVTFEEVKALWRTHPVRDEEPKPQRPLLPANDSRLADFLERARRERQLRISELEELQRLRLRARLTNHYFKTDDEIQESMDWLAKYF